MIKLPDPVALPALEIVPAAHGGFLVMGEKDFTTDRPRKPLYAGDLSRCLAFIEQMMRPAVVANGGAIDPMTPGSPWFFANNADEPKATKGAIRGAAVSAAYPAVGLSRGHLSVFLERLQWLETAVNNPLQVALYKNERDHLMEALEWVLAYKPPPERMIMGQDGEIRPLTDPSLEDLLEAHRKNGGVALCVFSDGTMVVTIRSQMISAEQSKPLSMAGAKRWLKEQLP